MTDWLDPVIGLGEDIGGWITPHIEEALATADAGIGALVDLIAAETGSDPVAVVTDLQSYDAAQIEAIWRVALAVSALTSAVAQIELIGDLAQAVPLGEGQGWPEQSGLRVEAARQALVAWAMIPELIRLLEQLLAVFPDLDLRAVLVSADPQFESWLG